jgi:hypothetical protein
MSSAHNRLSDRFYLSLVANSGGGYDSGSASDPKVDGSYLAAKVFPPLFWNIQFAHDQA